MPAPRLIRSGWWVVVAAFVLTAAVAVAMLRPVLAHRSGSAAAPEFELGTATVPRDLIVRAMARDAVHALDEPAFMTAGEVDRFNEEERGKLLVPEDRVVGIEVLGEVRAYPLRLLRWHEVVNDVVSGEPVAVTYSPLSDSVVVFSRRFEGRLVEIGASGLLYNSNTLLYDRERGPAASPLWTQLGGQPIAGAGAATAAPLELLPATLTTWEAWRLDNPESPVLAPVEGMQRLYRRDPYHSYFGSEMLRFPVAPLPAAGPLGLKDRLVVVDVAGRRAAYALPDLAAAGGGPQGSVELELGGARLRLDYRSDLGTAAVAAVGGAGELRSVRYGFWFAWHAIEGTIPDMIPAGPAG